MIKSLQKVFVFDCNVFNDSLLFDLWFARVSDERKTKVLSCRFEKDKFLSLGAGVLEEKVCRAEKFYNLSHSGHFAVCAAGNCKVGIDIEEIKPIEEDVIKSVCNESEWEHLSSIEDNENGEERLKEFYRIWTRKESYLKMLGLGIINDMRKIFDGKISESFFCEYSLPNYCIAVCSSQDFFPENTMEINAL